MLMPYTGIRRFEEDDVPQVAELHRRVMRTHAPDVGDWMQPYRNYFRAVFLSDAAVTTGLSSLVYQREGRIRGFLGVMPRHMQFQGKPLLAVVCSQFVVDPAERGQAGLQMLKRCFAGDQDLSITDEAAECTRKIWEWCGGTAALPYSTHWVRPLRPTQAALAIAGLHGARESFHRVLSPFARAADAVAARVVNRFRPAQPSGARELLTDETLLACLTDFAHRCAMGPAYDAQSVRWVLERVRGHVAHGALRAVAVKDDANMIAGWFIYHARRSGTSEVLQIGAEPRQHRLVLDHLFDDAWQQGVAVLTGRFEPAFAPHLSENGCLLYRRGYWTLVHAKRQEICHALQRGDAFFSRLEGEWCLRFS
jgi:hypothetical protein